MLVNQPSVRERSTPSTISSSRPCPSSAISTDRASSMPWSRRHWRTASANAVSSTSLTPAWNAAGTLVSSASVCSTGNLRVRCSTVSRSSTGSSGRAVSAGSGPVRMSVHSDSSAARPGRRASSTSRCAHRRNDVPTGSRSSGPGVRPAATASQAAAMSGSRIRHDTLSTTAWCTASSNDPGRVAPASNHTACAVTPSVGASRAHASPAAASMISRSRSPAASPTVTRRSHSPARTEPTGATRSVSSAPAPARSSLERSRSCRSARACSTAAIRSPSAPAGRVTSIHWLKASIGPPHSSNHLTMGVNGTSPTPAPGASPATFSATVATDASSATVRWVKTCRGVMTRPPRRARTTSWIETMLSPPRAKKSSSTPTSGRPSTSAYRAHSSSSRALPGRRPETGTGLSGTGRARRSSFPLGSTGSCSSGTNAVGTMWSGSHCRACDRRDFTSVVTSRGRAGPSPGRASGAGTDGADAAGSDTEGTTYAASLGTPGVSSRTTTATCATDTCLASTDSISPSSTR